MNQDLVEQLHTEVAQCLLNDLRNPETRTPGLYQAVLRFLKDNETEALPVPGGKLEELKNELQSLPFRATAG